MSGRQYPIWNSVEACIYKSDKSWGARETCTVDVKVGTSRKNSHDFVTHHTTHRKLEDGTREYRFYVDGKCLKRAILKDERLKFVESPASIVEAPLGLEHK